MWSSFCVSTAVPHCIVNREIFPKTGGFAREAAASLCLVASPTEVPKGYLLWRL